MSVGKEPESLGHGGAVPTKWSTVGGAGLDGLRGRQRLPIAINAPPSPVSVPQALLEGAQHARNQCSPASESVLRIAWYTQHRLAEAVLRHLSGSLAEGLSTNFWITAGW